MQKIGQFAEYKGYEGTIEYSPDDNTYFGTLLNITDFVNYEGGTIEELYKYYQEAVDIYIEMKNELEANHGRN